ncbi:hypothetical protein IW261DRAFT_1421346 [Armillaria novae-zelandiae]|uniref:Uncharacterized protein n=1 Tax=Armillaria novae-zelandiae TaxID=153914 RepID=A0AA39P3Y6_9AGAR|nr:hypothetical protein IW261DRAFT_1421346 [Armillaria novae-zelandiae]
MSFARSVKSKITALTSLPPSLRMSTNGKSSAKRAKDGECMSPIGISIGIGLQELRTQTYSPSDSVHTDDVLIRALAFRVNKFVFRLRSRRILPVPLPFENRDGIFDRVIGTITTPYVTVSRLRVAEQAARIQVTLATAAKAKGKERVIYRPLEMPEISVEHRIATTGWQRYLSDVQSGV